MSYTSGINMLLGSRLTKMIRTVAITPTKSSMYDWDTVVRVCQTSTMMGLRAMYEAGPAKPFRFIYCSGFSAERDQTKTPDFRPQYSLLRVSYALTYCDGP